MLRLLTVGLVLCTIGAAAAEPADGRKIAQTVCAKCHDVGIGAAAPGREGPPFAEIAKMPSTTELSLKVFLRSSHKNMPNLILSADEIDALSHYILELGGKGRS